MGKPEHIREILKRVMADLEEKYNRGVWSTDPCGDALHVPGTPSLAGGEDGKGLDKALPKTTQS